MFPAETMGRSNIMFSKLTEFDYQRNWKEAIGFYIVYLVITLILTVPATLLTNRGIDASNQDIQFINIGTLVAMACCLALAFIILKSKNQLGNIRLLLVGILGGIIAFFAGSLIGLVPVAFLSTQPKN